MLIELSRYNQARKLGDKELMQALAVNLVPWLINSGHTDQEHALQHEDASFWAWNTMLYSV